MSKCKFKVGDRVRATKEFNGNSYEGCTGTVISLDREFFWDISVEFDGPVYCGHTCHGKGKDGHCRWGYSSGLEIIRDNTIVITSNGKKTTAKLYEGKKVIKTASARCNPEDTFDFNAGAKLAFERLTGIATEEAKPELKIGSRVKVIDKRFCYANNLNGKYGRIIGIEEDRIACVEFDCAFPAGHNGVRDYLEGKKGHCWWGNLEYIVPTTEKTEKKPKSKYKVGDKVRVINDRCFHFNRIGEVLTLKNRVSAYDRNNDLAWHVDENSTFIRESDFEPYVEHYTGKVVCVKAKSGYAYTVGKVYEFKDGKVKIDNGTIMPTYKSIKSLDDWNNDEDLFCEFIPFVE